jgi:hypothetical protein
MDSRCLSKLCKDGAAVLPKADEFEEAEADCGTAARQDVFVNPFMAVAQLHVSLRGLLSL